MVALAVEPMGRALERPRALPPRRVRPEALQQGPAPQPQLGRALMAVKAPARVHQPAQPVHRPVDRVARAMAARGVVRRRVGLRLAPQLLQHLAHRGGQGLGRTPPLKLPPLKMDSGVAVRQIRCNLMWYPDLRLGDSRPAPGPLIPFVLDTCGETSAAPTLESILSVQDYL